MRRSLLSTAAWIGFATIGFAGPFTNGSFESPGLNPATNRFFTTPGNDTFVTGWTHVASAVNSNGNLDFYSSNGAWGINADNGSNYIGFGGSGTTGGILFQTFDTVIGTSYTVNYRLTTQQLPGNVIPLESVLVEGLNGATVLNSVSTSFNPLAGVWIDGNTLTFIATSTSSTLRFTDTSNGATAFSVNWGLDTVTVNSSVGSGVPEPATWSMIGLGVVALAAFRRRAK